MSRTPLYERVESVLAGDIADGGLPPETQLSPEEGLIERFKVSRTPVRKAIQNLVGRGLVEAEGAKVCNKWYAFCLYRAAHCKTYSSRYTSHDSRAAIASRSPSSASSGRSAISRSTASASCAAQASCDA